VFGHLNSITLQAAQSQQKHFTAALARVMQNNEESKPKTVKTQI